MKSKLFSNLEVTELLIEIKEKTINYNRMKNVICRYINMITYYFIMLKFSTLYMIWIDTCTHLLCISCIYFTVFRVNIDIFAAML